MYNFYEDGAEEAAELFGLKLASSEKHKDKKKKKKRSLKHEAGRAAGSVAGGAAAITAEKKLVRPILGRALVKGYDARMEPNPMGRAKEIRKGMGMTSKDVGIRVHNVDVPNGFYKPDAKAWAKGNFGKGEVNVFHNSPTAIIGHEMGHAKNYASLNRIPLVGKPLALGMGLGSLPVNFDLQNRYIGPTALTSYYSMLKDDPSYTPAMINLGIATPRLLNETFASAHATKYLIGKQGLGQGLKSSLPLAPALGTYLTPYAVPFGVTAGRKWWRKRHPSEHEQFEEAAADQPVEEPESSEEQVA